LLHDLIEAEPTIGERHHPVRLFIGSGMPTWLWQRSRDRFASVGVLEFFVAGAAGVVLVNASGDKIGAKGRPLPGSAEVRLIRYDLTAGRIHLDAHGRAQDAAVDEIGLLIAEPAPDCPSEILLRGLFAPGDRWASTEHLFRRDADRDYWLVAHTADVVRTADGPGAPDRAEDALGALPEVAMVAAYGLAEHPGNPQILVAALTLRPERTLSTSALNRALAPLAPADRPAVIRLVPTIPRTTWWRPDREQLRRAGAPVEAPGWRRDSLGEYGPVPTVNSADEQVSTVPGPTRYF
jgi:putative long chain acyl-CoA synthase